MSGVVLVATFEGPPGLPAERPSGDLPPHSRWQATDEPSDHVVLVRYSDLGAANADLRAVVDYEENRPNLPTEVHHVEIEHQEGRVLDAAPEEGFLTIARSVASPGYGHDEGEQVEEILSTFVQVEGYCGHLQGLNEAVREESWSFVFTTHRSDVPLPLNSETSIRVYRRIP